MIGASATATGAAIVALLESGPRTKAELRHELGGPMRTINAGLGAARAYGYVTIQAGVVSLTARGRAALEPEEARAS